jgi:hypothetical protein
MPRMSLELALGLVGHPVLAVQAARTNKLGTNSAAKAVAQPNGNTANRQLRSLEMRMDSWSFRYMDRSPFDSNQQDGATERQILPSRISLFILVSFLCCDLS